MSLLRRSARILLATSFIAGGVDQLRDPGSKTGPARPVLTQLAGRIPQLPQDPEQLVRLDGALKLAGGTGLVVGPFGRPAALLLAASLVPTTFVGHRFWQTSDPEQRVSDRVEFFKNLSLLGGLLITALDTGGRPSIGWRTRHAVDQAGDRVEGGAAALKGAAVGTAGALVGAVGRAKGRTAKRARTLRKR
jgi:uncharacterized membrane protein YphA (DoxX/SURF4 family)